MSGKPHKMLNNIKLVVWVLLLCCSYTHAVYQCNTIVRQGLLCFYQEGIGLEIKRIKKIRTRLRKVGLCLHFIHGRRDRQMEGRTNRQIKGQMRRQTALSDIQQIGTHSIFCLRTQSKNFWSIFVFVGDSLPSTHFFTPSVSQTVRFFQIN